MKFQPRAHKCMHIDHMHGDKGNHMHGAKVDNTISSSPPQPLRPPRISSKTKRPPTYLQHYHCNIAPTSITNQSSLSISFPFHNVISYSSLSSLHKDFALVVSSMTESTIYAQVVKHEYWKEAMNKEIEALELKNTWTITDLPQVKWPIGWKWVFWIKYKFDGTIECHKARLVS